MQVAGLLALLPLLAVAAPADKKDSHSGHKNGGRSGKRGIVVRRRPPSAYHQNIIYPPVHFLANGQPFKIFINNKEYTAEEDNEPISNKDDEILLQESTTSTTTTSTTTAATAAASNSPITWLSGHFPFNGLPTNIFYLPAPVRWLGTQLQTVMAQGGHIILG